ncbi:unnamed protein product [Rotaria sp. Silwood1]|nr:unnamed protein product [Rotaria sp. Silwood1]CAF3357443.1 unnamed protein product [Rotaria sp. Silwood1]CAF3358606.1 unnamed protein product [Rotaria sp. Silwood1]CAF3362664.1 unnamed protein product [Rotaria sp. Silwood1]
MSTTAYRSTHSSRSFTQKHIQTSSTNAILPTMTNDRTRFQSPTNNIPPPVPRIRESLSTNSITSTKTSSSISQSPSLPFQSFSSVNSSNKNSTNKISKQPYTFSNPPRELQRQSVQNMKYLRSSHLRQRVSSAPDENSSQNSPRSVINQQKPSSANESSTPRSHDDNHIQQLPKNHLLKRDEQQKSSLNALIKEQERSKVPKAVQKRRIILLFRRLPSSTSPLISPRQLQNSSPIKPDKISNDIHQQDKKAHDEIQRFTNNTTFSSSDSCTNDPFHGFDQAEIADSKQIAAILANIQSSDEWIPNTVNGGISPRHQQKTFDPTKYEYVTKNSLDTTTFKLSPRTLKPDEDLAARSRFSLNYRYEMLSSANAQIPPLMASIVTENNNNIGTGTVSEKTFTFRLNPTTTMKKQSSLDDIEPMPSTMDGEQVQLCFDEILKCFYDPNTGTYYELTSA